MGDNIFKSMNSILIIAWKAYNLLACNSQIKIGRPRIQCFQWQAHPFALFMFGDDPL